MAGAPVARTTGHLLALQATSSRTEGGLQEQPVTIRPFAVQLRGRELRYPLAGC